MNHDPIPTLTDDPADLDGRRWRGGSPVRLLAVVMLIGVAAAPAGWEDGDSPRDPWRSAAVHPTRIEALAFAPDGGRVVSAGADGSAHLIDPATGAHRPLLSTGTSGFAALAFAPDGRTLALATLGGSAVILDPTRPRDRITLDPPTTGLFRALRAVAIAPDARSVATGGDDRIVRVRDRATGHERLALAGHDGAIRALDFTPDGAALVSVAGDGRAIVWDLRDGRPIEQHQGRSGPLWSLAVAADGRHLALGGDSGFTLVDRRDGSIRAIPTAGGPVVGLHFGPRGDVLVVASRDRSVALWRVDPVGGPRLDRVFAVPGGRIKALAVNPDGRTVAVGGDDGVVRFRDLTGVGVSSAGGAGDPGA